MADWLCSWVGRLMRKTDIGTTAMWSAPDQVGRIRWVPMKPDSFTVTNENWVEERDWGRWYGNNKRKQKWHETGGCVEGQEKHTDNPGEIPFSGTLPNNCVNGIQTSLPWIPTLPCNNSKYPKIRLHIHRMTINELSELSLYAFAVNECMSNAARTRTTEYEM